jgi:hypothetical protein
MKDITTTEQNSFYKLRQGESVEMAMDYRKARLIDLQMYASWDDGEISNPFVIVFTFIDESGNCISKEIGHYVTSNNIVMAAGFDESHFDFIVNRIAIKYIGKYEKDEITLKVWVKACETEPERNDHIARMKEFNV